MSTKKKNAVYSLILALALLAVWLYRRGVVTAPIHIEGATMGTTYHITYVDAKRRNFKPQIDSLLVVLNRALSTYIPESEISRYNRGTALAYESPYFLPMLEKSKDIVMRSQGAFDPTVMPLVNAWGFGPSRDSRADRQAIDSIRRFVGFEKVKFNADSVWKTDPRVQLDFSAIAKGYGVDEVASFLRAQQVENSFVEIGGEVAVRGENTALNRPWQVGILHPESTREDPYYIALVTLTEGALATSGNYFNYLEKDGKKYTHTISPQSGLPVQQALLSASVFADDCATADAWATAFMVMGHPRAIETLRRQSGLEALLVYTTDKGMAVWATPHIQYQRVDDAHRP